MPEYLWEHTKDYAGISKENFFDYFGDKRRTNCYILGDCVKYDQPKKLEDFGVKVAPQSWIYTKEELVEKS